MSGEKTEEATPKRKEQARKEGNIPKSPELTGWAQILVVAFMLKGTVGSAATLAEKMVSDMGMLIASKPEPAQALGFMSEHLKGVLTIIVPLGATIAGVGVLGQLGQVGIHPSPSLLKPKFNRLNPASGIKKLFSPQSLWEATKTLIKLAALSALTRLTITKAVPKLTQAGGLSLYDLATIVVGEVLIFVRNMALLGILVSIVDYFITKRRTKKKMKMSKEDIKQESKSTEGNPLIKGAIRNKQMAMSRMRMMSEVSNADFVITNPVHLALALKYDPVKGAPRVLAKGAGAIAERIKAIAAENRLPVIEDKPLARTLFKVCELGDEIPMELYEAVARVLAFVFALKARGMSGGNHSAASGMTEELDLPNSQQRRRARSSQ
jgi:flagellar biosynthetic protein FlhB